MSATGLHQELLQAAVSALPPDRLSSLRETALSRFALDGFPTTRHEDWKYTSLADAAAVSNDWLENQALTPAAEALAVDTGITETIDAYWLTIRNGMIDSASLNELAILQENGVGITRLADGVDELSIAVDDPMSAFNAALLKDGIRLEMAADSRLDKPIGFLLVDDGSVALSQVRVLIDVGANAKLRIVECPTSAGPGRQFATSVTQATLGDGAELDFVRIQQRHKEHLNVNRFTATLGRDALLDYNNFEFGGRLARNDIVADIASPGACVTLRGLFLAAGRQHIDNHTRVDHRVGPAKSIGDYRGILNGRARGVFNGKVIVHKRADGTDADQTNHNLLLSDKAEMDTKPELEIYADDVKCSHGASVGQLDKSALFYLRSRGLDRDQATQALTRAFASAILGKLAIPACQDYLASVIDRELDVLIAREDDEQAD